MLIEKIQKLAQTILPQSFLEETDKRLRSSNISLSGSEYCGVSLLTGISVALAIFLVSLFISFPVLPGPVYAILGFFIPFVVLTRLLPNFFIQRRINELEEALPDGLRQMSTALKAGVSMDAALEDIAESEYGALSDEFERTLAQVRRGRPMQEALRAMAKRTRSELYQRAFFLIVEGMERGAELASVLEAVSDDIREVHTMQRERRAATMQQVLFLLAAALFAAPFIAGLVLSIGTLFSEISTGAGGGMGGIGAGGSVLPEAMTIVIPLYVLIQAAITGLAVGVIRYGDLSKGLMFVGPFMGAALGVFYAAEIFAGFMLPI